MWKVIVLSLVLSAGCAHRPQSQASVRSGQIATNAIWRAIFPTVETAAYWLLGKGLNAIRPDEPGAIVAEPQEEF